MRRLIIALVLAASVCSPVSAQDEQSLAAAQRLMSILSESMLNDVVNASFTPMWANLQSSLSGKVDQPTLDELKSETHRVMLKFVTNAMTKAPAIYARHFTADELEQLIAFYNTPVGKKTRSELPKVMGDFSTAVMIPMVPAMQSELQTSIAYVLKKHDVRP